jgi:hypothetical protein
MVVFRFIDINGIIDQSLITVQTFFFIEEFEDTKGVIRILNSKNKQHNCQKKKYKRTNKDLQSITHKTKDRVTRTPLKTGVELRCSGRVSSSCSNSGIGHFNKYHSYTYRYISNKINLHRDCYW